MLAALYFLWPPGRDSNPRPTVYEELGVSRNQYMNDALNLYVELDSKLLKSLYGLSNDLGVPAHNLIQNIFCRWISRIDAYVDIYGVYPDFSIDILSTGSFEEDYAWRKNAEKQQIEKEIVLKALDAESVGIELESYQKELLIKYRQGKAWLESDEYKREVEMQKFIEEKYPDAIKKNRELRLKKNE